MKLNGQDLQQVEDAQSYLRSIPPGAPLTTEQRYLRNMGNVVQHLRHPWRTRWAEAKYRMRAAVRALRGDG